MTSHHVKQDLTSAQKSKPVSGKLISNGYDRKRLLEAAFTHLASELEVSYLAHLSILRAIINLWVRDSLLSES